MIFRIKKSLLKEKYQINDAILTYKIDVRIQKSQFKEKSWVKEQTWNFKVHIL